MPRVRDALHKSFLERNQRVIGVFAIALLLGGSAMALLLTGGVFAKRYKVTAYFTDAAGIQPNDPVTVAGLDAGVVKGLRIEHGLVAVDLGVNKGVDLPADSRADIVVQTLLGKEAVNLVAGSSTRMLADGATIPPTRTTTPVDIIKLNDISVHLLNQSDAHAFDSFLAEVSKVTAGKGEQVHRLVTSLANLAQAIDDRRAQLSGLIDALKRLMTTLAGRDQTIVSLIDNLTPVMQNLAARERAIRTLLVATDSASHQTADLIRRNRGTLDATLSALHDDLAVLDQHQLDLAATIRYLDQSVEGYSSVGYSQGVPNRWANIFVQSLGPIGVDALLGQCGAVDQLIDRALGTNCHDTGAGPSPKPSPTGPVPGGGPTPPVPTPSLPVPTPTVTVPGGGPSSPVPSPSLPIGLVNAYRAGDPLPQDLADYVRAILGGGRR